MVTSKISDKNDVIEEGEELDFPQYVITLEEKLKGEESEPQTPIKEVIKKMPIKKPIKMVKKVIKKMVKKDIKSEIEESPPKKTKIDEDSTSNLPTSNNNFFATKPVVKKRSCKNKIFFFFLQIFQLISV